MTSIFNKSTKLLIAALLLVLIVSCNQEKKEVVVISTSYGEMTAVLYDDTPQHKENFLKLAKEGFYDSLLFHRIIEGFMIQGGDPNSKNAQPGQPLGNGGPGYTVPAEFADNLFHRKGALAAARLGDGQNPEKASSGSQFYIVQGTVADEKQLAYDQQKIGQALQKCFTEMPESELAQELNQARTSGNEAFVDKVFDSIDQLEELTGMDLSSSISEERVQVYTTVGGTPQLDDNYTVFGQVIDGLEVIDKIAAVQTAPRDRPLEDVRMEVSVKEMTVNQINKLFGDDLFNE